MQLYEEPPESKGSYILQGEDPHSRNLSPPLASMRLPLSIGDSSASGSPLEALHLPDGATVGRGREKRPRPTEQPHSSLLYPCGGEPQRWEPERKQLTPSRGRSSQPEPIPYSGIDKPPLFLASMRERPKMNSKLRTRFSPYYRT